MPKPRGIGEIPGAHRQRSLPERRFATLAVPAGTSGHGCGCIDMMTRFCEQEQEQEQERQLGRNADNDDPHHAWCLVQEPTLPPNELIRFLWAVQRPRSTPFQRRISPRFSGWCHCMAVVVSRCSPTGEWSGVAAGRLLSTSRSRPKGFSRHKFPTPGRPLRSMRRQKKSVRSSA